MFQCIFYKFKIAASRFLSLICMISRLFLEYRGHRNTHFSLCQNTKFTTTTKESFRLISYIIHCINPCNIHLLHGFQFHDVRKLTKCVSFSTVTVFTHCFLAQINLHISCQILFFSVFDLYLALNKSAFFDSLFDRTINRKHIEFVQNVFCPWICITFRIIQ